MKAKLFLLSLLTLGLLAQESSYREDDSASRAIKERDSRSHIKVLFPSMPYVYVSRLINEGLVRLAENDQGWEYSLATDCPKLSPTLYECTLRQGVRFQDGTPFNADSVIKNFDYFLAQPFNYTDIHRSLKAVEKVSPYKIRLILSQPYGMLFRDLARIFFYSDAYLRQYGWGGAETGANIKSAGSYGLGPYILVEGMITGRKQTPKAILKANPYYWEKGFPKIETITVFTELETQSALESLLEREGELDFMPIPFNKKIETLLSPYTKLIITPSTNNFTIYFNLHKHDSKVFDPKVRQALNCALNQENLLNFTYKKEGRPNTGAYTHEDCPFSLRELHEILRGLKFKVATQDSLLFLWRGIEYQLSRYGVELEFLLTTSEKEIYDLAQKNHQQTQEWDMLIQGTQDWYGRHPWPIFIRYQEGNPWSFVTGDIKMREAINQLFRHEQGTPEFEALCQTIIQRAKEKAYMLFIPTPHAVYGMNKELHFTPHGIGLQPLWKAEVTSEHWSLRGDKPYPESLQKPILPQRITP
ncbi:PUTATIVE PERIPLASMIC BINDING PROTEIN [Wolinella succinogenes]|uniref:PUTATIVE PERIPLASMIC BINDING PROTEIN n=2 Tax=Wolinella succinogenes TaxID=844 RepID=Q7M8T0_WOLSU|nr:PUTATIVE PERIPLASMIC BINDING PROTEIN [Wolinella succinogenes]VEG80640.1 Glutathione-binding protein gsiB precursor [Wolinella succinogenes]